MTTFPEWLNCGSRVCYVGPFQTSSYTMPQYGEEGTVVTVDNFNVLVSFDEWRSGHSIDLPLIYPRDSALYFSLGLSLIARNYFYIAMLQPSLKIMEI